MKKLFVLLLCLSSTMLFAQTLHYTIDNTGTESMQTTITGVFMLDGVEIYNGEGMEEGAGGQIEIGVFDENGICRGAKLPSWRSKTNQWYYQLKLRGYANLTYPTFKVYDHATETEFEYVLDVEETFVWTANGKYGSITNMYPINFHDPNASAAYEREIIGYGIDNFNSNVGYYLVATPVDGVNPSDCNMVTDPSTNFDLYYFDQYRDDNREWVNYQDLNHGGGFDLEVGKGYLYANMEGTTMSVAGTPYDGDGIFELDYKEEAPEFKGVNLIGNPYTEPAYLDCPFYKMNEDRTDVMVSEGEIEMMEGVFVIAKEPGKSVTFIPANSKLNYNLVLNLKPSMTSTVIDRAIVNFGDSQELTKFQLFSNNAKVYIPKDCQDYAVVNAGQLGELPVCFKADKNASYTFDFKAENVDFTYLHLIDNKTGNDVNLLATPSYSFDALTTDYASRFRLVFATGSSVDGNDFSFVNASGNLCIFGIEGDATIQVIDILGHVISSENFNGSYEKQLNVTPGIYMLRLIQGSDMKVQKMVIK